jgi:pseudaminic acid synthase
MTKEITIGNKKISSDQPTFIIAELSGNHHQNYDEAIELIKKAADAGADAIKIQTYTADTLTLDSNNKWFIVGGKDQPDAWKNQSLHDLYKTAYTPWDWQSKLKKVTEDHGMLFFSTPFDDTAVDFLEDMGVLFYKIASYEAIHIPLLKKVAQTGKPVIISVGFATLPEVELAVKTLKENGSGEVVVLHCVTEYSDNARLQYMNLKTIADIRERFGVQSGFSDNNAGIQVPTVAATVAGASVVEKHLTLRRTDGGPDARFSLEPDEFKKMVTDIRKMEKDSSAINKVASKEEVEIMMGSAHYGPASKKEEENTLFRPSIWIKKLIKKGEVLTTDNIRVARPKHGLAPKYFDEVLGKKTLKDIPEATPLSWGVIENRF